jgi:hypothetical protein
VEALKLKGDFVTNSSSTSYVVFIPEDFEIKSFDDLENPYDNFDEEDDDEILEIVRVGLKRVKEGDTLYEEDDYSILSLLKDICNKNGFVLDMIDTDSDRGVLSGITKEAIEKVLNWKDKKNENKE